MDPLENQDRHENELELPCDEEALQEVLPAAAALVEAIEDDDGDELVCSGQEKYDQILKDFDYQKEEPKLKDQLEKSAERMPTDGSTFGSESVLPAALSHEQRQMLPFLPPMNSETFFASSLFKEIISSKSRVEGLQNVYSESQKLQAQQFHAGGSGQPTADHLKSSFGNVAGFYPWFRQEGEAKDRDKNILSGAEARAHENSRVERAASNLPTMQKMHFWKSRQVVFMGPSLSAPILPVSRVVDSFDTAAFVISLSPNAILCNGTLMDSFAPVKTLL
eukprot:CAMPEP_0116826798 /NCGR_PEP_ID=MMETSP0418-20121206/2728_1 /TAXON_ID=1158023 /ORGANISM="Astrosyne radiata, Strain 13vi08-1A" /LENGTH=277 /DNA_ID=CAMNT_0004455471 /DNA_START=2023 /DNA_END=2857 /DNA_ORIENTATION=+